MTLIAKLGWAALAGLIFAVLAGGMLVDASAETDIGPINGPATVEGDCSTGVTDERGICQPVGCCEEAPESTIGDVCYVPGGPDLPAGQFRLYGADELESVVGTHSISGIPCGPPSNDTTTSTSELIACVDTFVEDDISGCVAVADPPTMTLPATGSGIAIQTALAALLLILGPAALWVARR
jgi:hypothetical protein